MDAIPAVFFIFTVIILFLSLFVELKSDFLPQYLMVILVASLMFVIIFQVKIVLWLVLVCAIGLIFHSSISIAKKLVLLIATVLYITFYQVPSSSSEFDDYLKKEHGLFCKSVDCLQISGEDDPNVKADISAIQSRDLHWYFFWARGEITTENQSIEAVNVLGFWLPVK